ncbi:MAG: phage integrase SAM-like domain-containing protein [Bacteroidales bacterium]|jgi:hypothetical protein
MTLSNEVLDGITFPFFQEADTWLTGIKETKTNQTYRNYKMAIDVAREFESKTDYRWDADLMDERFYNRFVQFLIIDKGLLDTTAAKYIATLRRFIKIGFPEYDFPYFHYSSFMARMIFLEAGELIQLQIAELKPPYDKIRDLFLFTACSGLRYEDSQRYLSDWEVEGAETVVEYPQLIKSRGSYAVLQGEKERILRAYGGVPPQIPLDIYENGLRALLYTQDLTRDVEYWEPTNGKKKMETRPLALAANKDLGRQTYIIQLLLNNVPVEIVMEYAGHHDYRTFMPYLEVARRKLKNSEKHDDFYF